MIVKLIRDGEVIELDDKHTRALVMAVLDAQRAAYGRSFHAQRADKLAQAQEHLTQLARLQRLADFLVGRDSKQEM